MQAIILAAGEGKRMRPLTLDIPKPLLKIKGKPIIEHIFHSLPPGVTEVIVVVKYLGDKIRSHLGSFFAGRKVIFVEGCGQGTAADFLLTKDFVESDRFLVIYGDEIPNHDDVANCLTKDFSLLVFKSDNPTAHGIVILKDGLVKGKRNSRKARPSAF